MTGPENIPGTGRGREPSEPLVDLEGSAMGGRELVPGIKLELHGDQILAAIKEHAIKLGIESLPQTPRRPDVRGIVLNGTDGEIKFENPGGHSDHVETIPAGQAFMIMPKGDSLAEQATYAKAVFERFQLAEKGVTQEFLSALADGDLKDLVAEAYGPAPYEKQKDALVDSLTWKEVDGQESEMIAMKGSGGSFGVRAPGKEEVYRIHFPDAKPGDTPSLRGTNTVAENLVAREIYLGVTQDWQTGEISTKPIAPSVAAQFYGEHLANIPSATVDRSGNVTELKIQ